MSLAMSWKFLVDFSPGSTNWQGTWGIRIMGSKVHEGMPLPDKRGGCNVQFTGLAGGEGLARWNVKDLDGS